MAETQKKFYPNQVHACHVYRNMATFCKKCGKIPHENMKSTAAKNKFQKLPQITLNTASSEFSDRIKYVWN